MMLRSRVMPSFAYLECQICLPSVATLLSS